MTTARVMRMADTNLNLPTNGEDLKTLRDDLRVRAHLGKLDLQDRIEEIDSRWVRFRNHVAAVGKETSAAAKSVLEAARLLVSEIRTGARRIRAAI